MANGARSRLLGEILVAEGLTSPDAVERALTRQRTTGELIGQALVALGVVTQDEVLRAVATQISTTRLCASWLSVGLSPVVPTGTRP